MVLGDWWDFHSLNSHEEPGSAPLEGARVKDDLDVGNEAFARLDGPIQAEIERIKKNKKAAWEPELEAAEGNHENRADRFARNDPRWFGLIGSDQCNMGHFTRHRFLERFWKDGICFSHYMQSEHSARPIGGSIDNRLNKIGASFVCGHEQGLRYGSRVMACGVTRHGIVAGSCYVHREEYRGNGGQNHFRGVIVANEVRDGDYCVMPLTLDYLARKFEGMSLYDYHRKKYPDADWRHLE